MSHAANGHCWNCGKLLDGVLLPLSRHEYCRSCSEALHCCRQCRWFAPGAPAECRESRAEPPTDKTTANFCDWFEFAPGDGQPAHGAADAARARLEALFGPPESRD